MTNAPILMVHCFYQQPGGEDAAYIAEAELLEKQGHRVERMELHNDSLRDVAPLRVAATTIWNASGAQAVAARVRSTGARLVHFHNTFPLLSPAVYGAAQAAGARVVQTLHNYRLICPSALLLRDGKPCEACVGRAVPWPAVQHGCYRDGHGASAVVATMLTVHRVRGTWQRQVDAFIALSAFARGRLVSGGLPADRVHVRGAYLSDDPGTGAHAGGYALFVGRLSEEKGIRVLLEAWRRLQAPVALVIVGDGPLHEEVARAAAADARITWERRLSRDEVLARMQDAAFQIVPSICYENGPVVIAEASATGLPVVASDLGSMREMVEAERSGLLFAPGDSAALAAAAERLAGDADLRQRLGNGARRRFEAEMSATPAYERLCDIYRLALQAA